MSTARKLTRSNGSCCKIADLDVLVVGMLKIGKVCLLTAVTKLRTDRIS